jgi:hypothetical protein
LIGAASDGGICPGHAAHAMAGQGVGRRYEIVGWLKCTSHLKTRFKERTNSQRNSRVDETNISVEKHSEGKNGDQQMTQMRKND